MDFRLKAVIVVLVLIFAALSVLQLNQKPSPRTLIVSSPPYVFMSPIYIAEENGLFKTDVKFIDSSQSSYALESVMNDDIDVVPTSLSAKLFSAYAKGLRFKVIAMQDTKPRAMLIRKDLWESGVLRSPEDLKGKNVRVSGEGAGTYYILAMLLKNNGIDLKDVNMKYLSSSESLAAFESKSIDAFTSYAEPFRTYAIENGIAVYQEFPGEDNIGVFLVSEKTLQEKPEAIKSFLRGYVWGIKYYASRLNGSEEERVGLIRLVSVKTGIETETLEKIKWPVFPTMGKVDLDEMRRIQDYYFDNGLLDSKADVDEMFDFSILDEILAEETGN